ncbi:MAG: hypothetical protein KJ607_01305 [Bacteroidetes bacterium]|nr:hypothetical protein [Bacteroidota bacterium]
MKKAILILSILISCTLWLNGQVTTSAPICLKAPTTRGISELPAASVSLTDLKAVLIVGPCESSTEGFINEMKEYAEVLKERGVTCYEFYSPDNSWDDIKKAAEGAHFLLYGGHGIYNGTRPPDWVGSFCLNSGFVRSEKVLSDLKLAKGAIVMFNHACFSAGAAGGDHGDIGSSEAKRRVNLYSKPFLSLGISAYYSSGWYNSLSEIIAALFAGDTFGEAYKDYCIYNEESTIRSKHPDNTGLDVWISSGYNYTFVGNSSKTLSEIFGN